MTHLNNIDAFLISSTSCKVYLDIPRTNDCENKSSNLSYFHRLGNLGARIFRRRFINGDRVSVHTSSEIIMPFSGYLSREAK
jgi:hypothetical protein